MTTSAQQIVRFEETQRWAPLWVWVLVLATAGFAFWAFLMQIVLERPIANNPAPDAVLWLLLLLFGIAFPLLLGMLQLRVRVTDDAVDIRLFPLTHRRIALSEIQSATARRYRPIREYGGWGLRWTPKGIAYSLSGKYGVELELQRGKRVMIGSCRSQELEAAIRAAQNQIAEAPAPSPS